MTVLHDDPHRLESPAIGQVAAHWAGAAVTVLLTYAALIWLALSFMPQGAAGELQDIAMVELEPMTAFEEAPPPAPEPELAQAPPVEPEPVAEPEPEPPEPVAPEPVAPEPVAPEPVVEEPVVPEPVIEQPVVPEPPPIEKPEPVPEPTTQEVVPDLMETSSIAEAVINPPVPRLRPPPPKPVETTVRAQKKPVPPKKAEPPKAKVEKPRRAAEAKAPVQRSTAARSDRPAARPSAQAPRVSAASWAGQVNSHIRRFKRSVSSASRTAGITRLTMTIDAGGRVSGLRVVSSSGSDAFDAEALSLVRRASPLPAPPRGGQTLTLPVKM